MQEIIYKIDNWTIAKLLGGSAIILTALIAFFSKHFLTRLEQGGKFNYDKNLEDIKGEINKSNNVLNSVIQSYLTSSQKLIDKKIQAYDLLWERIVYFKTEFPAGISLVYQLFPDSWFEKSTAYIDLRDNPKLGPILKIYDRDQEMQKIVMAQKALLPHKPYLSDNSYKIYYTYQALIGRTTHQFIEDYKKDKIFNWKADKHLETILKISLTEKELLYIKALKIGSFDALLDLLEYKLLQDLRDNLNIKGSTTDTIAYLKDIEQIYRSTKD